MKRWFILLTCITTLTGCGAQPAGVTSSAPPADVTKESTESAMMTSAPTATPTAIPEVTPNPNRYPTERVIIETSEADKAGWTSTVHFTEPENKYFSLTYNDEKFCFNGETAREALITILCCISSTPMELYDSLLYNLYYVPDGEETMGSDWMVVGDSQIRVSFEESSQPRHIWTFHIKEK